MRTLLASAGLALLLALATQPSVSAQEPPAWMKQTVPDEALKPHWDEQLAVMNPTGALDGKTKHLIGLAVAAQIPCTYCVYGHTKLAKAAGATDAEIKEAIATAALVRFNSTMLNGSDGGLLFTFVEKLPGVSLNMASSPPARPRWPERTRGAQSPDQLTRFALPL